MIDVAWSRGKNIMVFGLGKTGYATVRSLSDSGAHVFVWDDGQDVRQKVEGNNFANVSVVPYAECDWSNMDALVLSPGVPYTHPKPHAIVDMANEVGCPIICDIELLYLADSQASFVGITGTNGKSTTTALLGHILNVAGVRSVVGGNIGVPVLDLEAMGSDGIYVVEMSSYQLDLIDKTRFATSVFLNVTPDHLDRHGGMAGYVKAKERIFMNQDKDCLAVVGVDDEYTLAVYNNLIDAKVVGKVVPISIKKRLEDGVSVVDGVLYDNREDLVSFELPRLKRLSGKHNMQNIVAAYVVAKNYGVSEQVIVDALHSFGGLEHRMQYVDEHDSVVYINDSKATNAEAAARALETFDNIYWILGGVAKEGGVESLSCYFSKVKKAYLIGESSDLFAKTFEGRLEYEKCGTLQEAFNSAVDDVTAGGVVLLSPACASFDQWPNFEVRGEEFCKMVREFVG